jgi:post-segregation antitoxin (ccd killing protein)
MDTTRRSSVSLPLPLWAKARAEGYSLSRVLQAALELKLETKEVATGGDNAAQASSPASSKTTDNCGDGV